MGELPEYNEICQLGLNNYLNEENREIIDEKSDDCLRVLHTLCEEMKHYGRRDSGKEPNIQIDLTENSFMRIIYDGPTKRKINSTYDHFNEVLMEKTRGLENQNELRNRIYLDMIMFNSSS